MSASALLLRPVRLVPAAGAPEGALPVADAAPWPTTPFAARLAAPAALPPHAKAVVLVGAAATEENVRRYVAEGRAVVVEAPVAAARALVKAGAVGALYPAAIRPGERKVREREAPTRAPPPSRPPSPSRSDVPAAADGTRPVAWSVAIVGIGSIFPEAPDTDAFWRLVTSARSAIKEVPKERWDASRHWDPDPSVPDKTYAKIGAFVEGFRFDATRFRLPPTVAEKLDPVQQWALTCAVKALEDAGYAPRAQDAKAGGLRAFDRARCAVILGNALGGEQKDLTAYRVRWNDTRAELERALAHLPEAERKAVLDRAEREVKASLPTITEDSMPGELSNVIAGRITNALDLGGKNVTTDAACASTLAALDTACRALVSGECDMVLTGGADRTMDPVGYVKFSKIGALSADGSRPFDKDANGFVMGEGCGILVLKRLVDAVRDGDRVYAVVRGVGASSDGKGKGITAPNPEGQKLAVRRAFQAAEIEPRHVQLVEAHGTSTAVGDVVEVQSLADVWQGISSDVPAGSVAIGSVKSQIGHLKSAAAAAGLVKAALALHHKVLPPSANFRTPNPNIDWARVPFKVQTKAEPWPAPPWPGVPRRAGVSSFGFGGTNFHAILEEYVPAYHGRLTAVRGHDARDAATGTTTERNATPAAAASPAPPRTAWATPVLVVAGEDEAACAARLDAIAATAPAKADAAWCAANLAPEGALRVAVALPPSVDAAARLREVAALLRDPSKKKLLATKGAFLGPGRAPGKVAFLFPGQGSQYADMLADMRAAFPVVDATFREADEVLAPYLPKPLTELLRDEEQLKETSVTQPAMLAADVALLRLLGEHGVRCDMVAGHSLGEYAALVAAGVLSFPDALVAVSARGKEMASVDVPDLGGMAGVAAPPDVVDEILRTVDGYVVSANKNSPKQTVIAGATAAVEKAMEACGARGLDVMPLPVSAAFHSAIVAPASEPLRRVLARLGVAPPRLPVIANVDAEPYPSDRERILDLLSKQVASPVEWVKTMHRMHADGCRVFVEVGPKRALTGFVEANLGDKADAVLTNHPKKGGVEAWCEAVAKLAALGVVLPSGSREDTTRAMARVDVPVPSTGPAPVPAPVVAPRPSPQPSAEERALVAAMPAPLRPAAERFLQEVHAHVADAERTARRVEDLGLWLGEAVVSGASVGLPGRAHRVFDDANLERLFRGESGIDRLSPEAEKAFLEKRIVRLVKDGGEPRFEAIETLKQVIHLAGQRGAFDLADEFGLSKEFCEGLDITSKLAIGAAIDALRDAGIPLVRDEVVTKSGHRIPGQWVLPAELRGDTGIVVASAFPGVNNLVDELARYFADRYGGEAYHELEAVYHEALDAVKDAEAKRKITRWFTDHAAELRASRPERYTFNRKFLFEILSLGHAEVAELLRARGPNTQVNAACASMTQAVALAEDWLRTGRARRVLVLGADDVTSETLLPWIGSGFLAAGAATTAETVADGALPFDRRRHGMIVGMGASGMVVERAEDVAERGMVPVAKILASRVSNSAYHGSRLDGDHIQGELVRLVETMERRTGLARAKLADLTLFMSHETYTPARGGSASAEVAALRAGFGPDADRVLVANVKGFTGHPMGAGIEDPVAVKCLQYGRVPPVPNLKEPDPELGNLNLAKGGAHDRRYAIRFSAGFGSQLAILAFEQAAKGDARVVDAAKHRAWLDRLGGGRLAVEKRTLKIVRDAAAPSPAPAPARAIVPQPRAPAPAVAVPVPSARAADVLGELTALMAEKTGYPVDALGADLDLEADLGIDTVKQAELFGQVRERYGLARDDSFKIKDHNTLAKIAAYVERSVGGPTPSPPPASPATPAVVPASPAPPVAPAPVPAASGGDVLRALTALMAERTGYPVEALEPDLDLEADLGIDTVKQAELFGQVREKYALPRDESFKIKDHNTLAKIAAYVQRSLGGPVPAVARPLSPATPTVVPAPPVPTSAATSAPASGEAEVLRALTALMAEKTGYPPEALEPHLDLEADLGIDTVKQAELFGQVREKYALPRDDAFKIKDHNTLGRIAAYVAARLASPAPAVAAAVPVPAGAPPPSAALTVRVPVVVPLGPPAGAAWDLRGKRVLVTPGPLAAATSAKLRAAGASVVASPPCDAVVAQAEAAATGDASGAKHLFDLARQHGPFRLVAVSHLGGRHGVEHATGDPAQGALTGLAKGLAREWPDAKVVALDLDPGEPDDARAGAVLEELARADTVEVGRRGGVRATLALRDAPPVPGAFAAETVVLATGGAQGIAAASLLGLAARTKLKAVLLGRTPLAKDAPELAALDAAGWEALKQRTFADLKAKGEKATPVAVEKLLAPMRKRAEIQRTLDALATAGAEAVYVAGDAADPRALREAVAACRARFGRVDVVLHAAGVEESRPVKDKDAGAWGRTFGAKVDGARVLLEAAKDARTFVLFGSVAGRFGNAAQADYSAANDALAKLAWTARAAGRDVRALEWGPWGETGMATRGSTMTVLKAAGVEAIPTADGVAAFLAELASPGRAEVVLAANLGLLEVRAPAAPAATFRPGDLTLDPAKDAWLKDHAVDGVPYLPGVHGLALFGDAHEGGLEDVRFGYPVKFLRDRARTMRVRRDGDALALVADAPQGARDHFTARAAASTPAPAPAPAPAVHGEVGRDAIYARFFHGPAFQVLASARVGATGVVAKGATPPPSGARNLDLEAALQAAGLHALAVAGAMALPHAVARVERWGVHAPGALELRATFRGTRPEGPTTVWTYDVDALAGKTLAFRLTGLELIAIGEGATLPVDPVAVAWREVGGRAVAVVEVGADVEDVRALLHVDEISKSVELKVAKRRQEWLAATLAAKAALRRAEGATPWPKLKILNHADGYRTVEGARHAVSVGHAGGLAVAVAYDAAAERVGVDVEAVEARPASWAAEAFAPGERAALATDADRARAWAAKEALLKALGRGLAEDLHQVRVTLQGDRVTYDLHGDVKAKVAAVARTVEGTAVVADGRAWAVCRLAA